MINFGNFGTAFPIGTIGCGFGYIRSGFLGCGFIISALTYSFPPFSAVGPEAAASDGYSTFEKLAFGFNFYILSRNYFSNASNLAFCLFAASRSSSGVLFRFWPAPM